MGHSETSREASEPSSDLYEPSDVVGLPHAPTEDHDEDSDHSMDESDDESNDESDKGKTMVVSTLSTGSRAAKSTAKDIEGCIEKYYSGSALLDIPGFLNLPAEIWQQIFLYLPPITLARLLSLHKIWNAYLTATHPPSNAKSALGRLCLIDSESIWTRSRNIHHGRMPRPLNSLSELRMWQLLGGRHCQFCGPTSSTQHASAISGHRSVRVVWRFAIRTCMACLAARCQNVSTISSWL